MRFYGTNEEFESLKNNSEGLVEVLLSDAFNRGYNFMYNTYAELYKQAESAIDENIPIEAIAGANNPFITLLAKYNEKLKEMSTNTEDINH